VLAPLTAHADAGATVTVGTIERPDPGASGVVEADAAGWVTRFVEKPGGTVQGPAAVSAGVLVCEPKVLDFVPSTPPSDIGRDVLPALLRAGEPARAVPLQGGIRWIDTPSDLRAAERLIA
jgi:mannose-1-phosphate guanylyltransferase